MKPCGTPRRTVRAYSNFAPRPGLTTYFVLALALASAAACGGGGDDDDASAGTGGSPGAQGAAAQNQGGTSSGAAGSSDGASARAGGANAGGSSPGGSSSGGASNGGASPGGAGGAGGGGCEAFGHFGAPKTTFTLPTPPAGGSISYPDVRQSFPKVDWANLDRLYVPAGSYKTFELGNLPKRDPSRPLVITNRGGQVKVGPNLGGNFIWSMGGGSNWVLTGRYDEASKTGDASFAGHRCGAYANSRGTYGFLSDDALDHSAPYLHMGLAVTAATSFEIEFVEVERSGFAGIRLINERSAGDPAMPMENVRVHDTYVHDTDAEGYYFGWTGDPPSNLFPGLQIYNNRVVRTGNEALQIQELGEGAHVYDNVFAFGALHWLDNGLGNYQDHNAQVQVRSGNVTLEHNVFLGGAADILSFFSGPEAGDEGRQVVFSENYFGETSNDAGYIGGTSKADSSYTFRGNYVRGFFFDYTQVSPSSKAPTSAFSVGSTLSSPVLFEANTWEGDLALVDGLSADGVAGMVTTKGNHHQAVTPIAFANWGYPSGVAVRALHAWSAKATLAPGSPVIQYKTGDVVTAGGSLYQCSVANQNQSPPDHPESWKKLADPADDLRVSPGTYAQMGVH